MYLKRENVGDEAGDEHENFSKLCVDILQAENTHTYTHL